jgi:hypothetical protein
VVDTARFGQLATWDAALTLAQINAPLGFMIYWRANVILSWRGLDRLYVQSIGT